MALLWFLDIIIAILGVVGIGYQALCIVVSFIVKPIVFPEVPQNKRFAILVAARNEESVIANLITSIRANTYPQDLVDIWLVADNCTDNTADLVRSLGEHVIERHDLSNVGKGYALTFLLNHMIEEKKADDYDAFFIFDADNLLDSKYISEMNKAFQSGFAILTSYRNSKNFAENWVSSGSALWFLREARFLNSTRQAFGTSANVGGTGFMFSREVMERNDGWKFHLLTEDMEFTLDSVLHGDKIGYCASAMFYDEQPVTFAQSWRQRLRWSKGYYQVFRYYGGALMRRAIVERDFSAVDLTFLIGPFTFLWACRELLGFIFAAAGFVTWESQFAQLGSFLVGTGWGLVMMMGLAAITVIAERDKIIATNKELLAYCLSFPIFMASTVPLAFAALFSKPDWKPIVHHGQKGDVPA